MPNFLTINRTYADNDVLYEADLNNLATAVETFLNSTKLNEDNLATSITDFFTPAGMIAMFSADSVPTAWLECDGSAVSQATYADLYAVLGSTYNTGGEGAGNFRLPNYARRTPVGSGGSSSGTLSNTLGSTGGEETHILNADKSTLPAHTHADTTGHYHLEIGSTSIGGSSPQSFAVGGLGGASIDYVAGVLTSPTTPVYNTTGSGGAHNNVQPSLVMMFMIKT